MKRIAIIAALALAACSHTDTPPPEPIIKVVEVQVPVDDPKCAREAEARLGASPAYPDTPEAIQAAANLFERVKLLLAGRVMRVDREEALTAAIKACASIPPPAGG